MVGGLQDKLFLQMVAILPNRMQTLTLAFLIALNLIACGQSNSSNTVQNLPQKIKKENSMEQNQNSQPEQIVMALIEAMSVSDAEKIRSLFNKDARQAYGESGSWKSGEAFFKWLQSDIIDRKGHVDNAKFSTEGNEVIVTGQYSSVGYTNKANFLFSVEDGKIKSWQMRY